jgi:hypothetical protein
MLASETFSRSARLSAFLQFVVQENLKGRSDGLKEQVIASELYGKPPTVIRSWRLLTATKTPGFFP